MEFIDAEFWVAVAFVVFVGAVGPRIWKAAATALDARARRIAADLDEARRLRDEAERLLAEYRQKERDSERQAAAILEAAREEARLIGRQATQDLEAALARREKAALDKIAQAEADALAEVRGEAVDLAVAAAARLLDERLDEARRAALVDRSIGELSRKLH